MVKRKFCHTIIVSNVVIINYTPEKPVISAYNTHTTQTERQRKLRDDEQTFKIGSHSLL
jgi:hypothetical protein